MVVRSRQGEVVVGSLGPQGAQGGEGKGDPGDAADRVSKQDSFTAHLIMGILAWL